MGNGCGNSVYSSIQTEEGIQAQSISVISLKGKFKGSNDTTLSMTQISNLNLISPQSQQLIPSRRCISSLNAIPSVRVPTLECCSDDLDDAPKTLPNITSKLVYSAKRPRQKQFDELMVQQCRRTTPVLRKKKKSSWEYDQISPLIQRNIIREGSPMTQSPASNKQSPQTVRHDQRRHSNASRSSIRVQPQSILKRKAELTSPHKQVRFGSKSYVKLVAL